MTLPDRENNRADGTNFSREGARNREEWRRGGSEGPGPGVRVIGGSKYRSFHPMKSHAVAWAALVLSCAALVGSRNFNRPAPAAQEIPAEGQKAAKALSDAFEAVAEFAKPSVVQIRVEKKVS